MFNNKPADGRTLQVKIIDVGISFKGSGGGSVTSIDALLEEDSGGS